MYINKFKKFGGEWIPNIIEYLKSQIDLNTDLTISVGCDSVQKRRKTFYAFTIMFYNNDVRNGAHVVFYRQSFDKIRDNFERLTKEALLTYELAEYLDGELSKFYKRSDITDFQRKSYKFHLLKCDPKNDLLNPSDINAYISGLSLTDFEKSVDYMSVDIHLDFNPHESTQHSRGRTNNKSNLAYKTYVPWLRGMSYRVYSKPLSFAASSAADLLLQE